MNEVAIDLIMWYRLIRCNPVSLEKLVYSLHSSSLSQDIRLSFREWLQSRIILEANGVAHLTEVRVSKAMRELG